MSAYICPQHPEPNPLCLVQQAAPRIRPVEVSADKHRANAFAGCAFILGAAIVTVALWVTLIAWLLP